MKIALIGGLLITLPAIATLVYSVLTANWIIFGVAALVLAYNLAPFLILGIMSKKAKVGDDLSGH